MVAKFMPFFAVSQPLPAKQQINIRLAQVFSLLATQAVGAFVAGSIGNIRDANNPALIGIILGDNQRGGAYPLYARLVYPVGTEDAYFPLHITLARGSTSITTARRSAIVAGEGGRIADYEVVGTGGIGTGTWPDGFASIGHDITVDLLFEAPPAPPATPYHTFTVTSGTRDTFVGFWHNNIGSATDRVYTLPNGNNTQIRQVMIGGSVGAGMMRYLFGQTRYQADQFPERIRLTNGANVAVLRKPDPPTIISAGQGNGIDYDVESGTLGAVFNNGETIDCELYYPD